MSQFSKITYHWLKLSVEFLHFIVEEYPLNPAVDVRKDLHEYLHLDAHELTDVSEHSVGFEEWGGYIDVDIVFVVVHDDCLSICRKGNVFVLANKRRDSF